jgi:hypothetical protein
MLSTAQFGDGGTQLTGQMFQQHPTTSQVLPLSANTLSSASRATAWSNQSLSAGSSGPLPLSSRTEGSVYKFDDNSAVTPPFGM